MRSRHVLAAFLFYIFYAKTEDVLWTKQYYQTNHNEITTKLLKPRLKNSKFNYFIKYKNTKTLQKALNYFIQGLH
jgi:hypothetical protein